MGKRFLASEKIFGCPQDAVEELCVWREERFGRRVSTDFSAFLNGCSLKKRRKRTVKQKGHMPLFPPHLSLFGFLSLERQIRPVADVDSWTGERHVTDLAKRHIAVFSLLPAFVLPPYSSFAGFYTEETGSEIIVKESLPLLSLRWSVRGFLSDRHRDGMAESKGGNETEIPTPRGIQCADSHIEQSNSTEGERRGEESRGDAELVGTWKSFLWFFLSLPVSERRL